jgi:hypothetical protein
MFRGTTIGLIWDKHSSHFSAEVEEFVEKCNADKANDTRIVLELVDEGLTPIIQVPDIAVNKVFKAAVDVIAMSLVYYSRDIGVKSLALFC